jgi:hypothetical protein
MRYLAAALAVGALALAGCDQGTPTGPSTGSQPQLQATSQTVNISGKGTAEILPSTAGTVAYNLETHVAFQCPEGATAFIEAHVEQPRPPFGVAQGDGFEEESCRYGPNSASVFVPSFALNWDVGKAHAKWTLTVYDVNRNVIAQASAEKDILITTQ